MGRFSSEDVGPSTPEKKPTPTTPPSAPRRSSADWLGLKTKDDQTSPVADAEEAKTPTESRLPPPLERRPSLTGGQADNLSKQVCGGQQSEEEEGGALSRWTREAQMPRRRDSLGLGEDADVEATVGYTTKEQTTHTHTGTEGARSSLLNHELLFVSVNQLPEAERTLSHLPRKPGEVLFSSV